jgi:hypothetical protein
MLRTYNYGTVETIIPIVNFSSKQSSLIDMAISLVLFLA